jgi:hypothetical protein
MNAAEILDAARAAGLYLAVDGTDLVLESSSPPPPDLIDLFRNHKAEIIAAIPAAGHAGQETEDTVVDWCGWYEERAAIRQFDGGYTREEAARLAWGEAQDRWHRAHGERTPRDLCAGCRRPIGSAEILDLSDGNRVHFGDVDCLIRHGQRWRRAAGKGLIDLGLKSPKGQPLRGSLAEALRMGPARARELETSLEAVEI